MKKFRIIAILLAALIAAGTLNIEVKAATGGVVTGNGVNVRAGASKDSEKIGSLNGNEEVTILEEENGWYKIEYKGGTGYVSADYVDKKDEAATDTEGVADTTDGEENDESEDVDEEEVHLINPAIKTIGIILLIALLLLIIIVSTIISIRRLDDDDDYDDYDDYDDDYDDEYGDDEYEDDEYEDDEYEDEDEDEYEDDDYEDGYDDGYREPVRRRPAKQTAPTMDKRKKAATPEVKYGEGADPARYMSNNPDDYRIEIDPKFFETSTLPKLSDDDAPTPVGKSRDTKREADIEAAMKKMEDLQKEIERLKNK